MITSNTDTTDLRKSNRYRVLNIYRKHKTLSRKEASNLIRLSQGTLTNITSELLERNVLTSLAKPADQLSSIGRPEVKLQINPSFGFIISVSLTFNTLVLHIRDYTGETVHEIKEFLVLNDYSAKELAIKIQELCNKITPENTSILVISIGVQGTVSKDKQNVLWSPILSDHNKKFCQYLRNMTNTRVIIDNDCAMIAIAMTARKKDNTQTFGAVLLSYGIGLGLHINGEILEGSLSSASEFGHIPYILDGALCRCGKNGCIEAYASDYAIYRQANEMDENTIPEKPIDHNIIADIVAKAEKTDGAERKALSEASKALAFGLAALFTLFDHFEVNFIGSGSLFVSAIEDELRYHLRKNYRSKERSHLIFSAELDEKSMILNGATITALDLFDEIIATSST